LFLVVGNLLFRSEEGVVEEEEEIPGRSAVAQTARRRKTKRRINSNSVQVAEWLAIAHRNAKRWDGRRTRRYVTSWRTRGKKSKKFPLKWIKSEKSWR